MVLVKDQLESPKSNLYNYKNSFNRKERYTAEILNMHSIHHGPEQLHFTETERLIEILLKPIRNQHAIFDIPHF